MSKDEKTVYFNVQIDNMDKYTFGLGALDAETGETLWITEWLPSDSTPVVGDNGNIYITTTLNGWYGPRNGLGAFSKDGDFLWEFITNEVSDHTPLSSPALGPDGTIYFSSYDPLGIYAVTPEGDEKWFLSGVIFGEAPAIDADGTLYISSLAISSEGKIKWEVILDGYTPINSLPTIIGGNGTIYSFIIEEDTYYSALIAIGEKEK